MAGVRLGQIEPLYTLNNNIAAIEFFIDDHNNNLLHLLKLKAICPLCIINYETIVICAAGIF